MMLAWPFATLSRRTLNHIPAKSLFLDLPTHIAWFDHLKPLLDHLKPLLGSRVSTNLLIRSLLPINMLLTACIQRYLTQRVSSQFIVVAAILAFALNPPCFLILKHALLIRFLSPVGRGAGHALAKQSVWTRRQPIATKQTTFAGGRWVIYISRIQIGS